MFPHTGARYSRVFFLLFLALKLVSLTGQNNEEHLGRVYDDDDEKMEDTFPSVDPMSATCKTVQLRDDAATLVVSLLFVSFFRRCLTFHRTRLVLTTSNRLYFRLLLYALRLM